MSENTFRDNQSDGSEDEFDDSAFTGRSGLILAIDCDDKMFNDSEKFREALDIAESIMRNKVTASEKDLVALVFFNTMNNPAPEDDIDQHSGIIAPRHSAIFLHLNTVSVEMIRKVRSMLKSDDFLNFGNKYGHSEDASLANVFWMCSRMFSHCGYKLEQSTIFLFTMNDHPHTNNSLEHQQTLTKARDLLQKDISVVLVPLFESFDCGKFYKELLCTVQGEDENDFIPPVYQQSKEQLLQRILTKDFKKRSLAHLKWYLSEDVALAVNVYSLSRTPRFPKKVKLLRSTNEVIISKRVHVASGYCEEREEETSKTLLPGEQRKAIRIGGETVSFKPDELIMMKQILTPGIRLLGFKPVSSVVITNHVRCSMFLYPNETHISGSTLLLRALYEKCLEKGQAAYCTLTMRRKQSPKLVALVPQEQAFDEDGVPRRYAGFRVEFVPYADDIRNTPYLDKAKCPTITDSQIEVFKKVIKKIRFKYNPVYFDNPASQSLYSNIESLVFDMEKAEFFDSTHPDYETIDSKLDPFVDEIKNLFSEDPTSAPKRSRLANNEESPSKAKAWRVDPSPVSDAELFEMVSQGKASSLTVATLKEFLQKQGVVGVSKLRTKAMLIDKITELQTS
ncbi:X-ray repair cross-complementing protein 5 [Anopheles bellator]|uniref:X-ray repair cross-complementing protein 5 n=1 Tax=Anopheles bellator TaxID=139047 RepID=UPI00264817B7|nr:X-ray repair cross-complementing protein 5 [Anopheles bellator]